MSIKTLIGNRVLVELFSPETKTAGGIEIPQTLQKRCDFGIVRMLGSKTGDVRGRPLMDDIKIGDTVRLNNYSGSVEVGSPRFRIYSIFDVVCVIS